MTLSNAFDVRNLDTFHLIARTLLLFVCIVVHHIRPVIALTKRTEKSTDVLIAHTPLMIHTETLVAPITLVLKTVP